MTLDSDSDLSQHNDTMSPLIITEEIYIQHDDTIEHTKKSEPE